MGVDGEGHKGAYFLLAAALEDGTSWQRWSSRPEGLSTRQCLEFLCGLPKEYVKWGFSFGYDVNMMLKDLHWTTLQRLHEETRVRWSEFYLEWIPGKKFHVAKREWNALTGAQGATVASCTIWDMFPWQGTSFVTWLKDAGIADPGTFPVMEYMKKVRSDFDPDTERDEITAYCLDECRLLARGAKRLHEMLEGQDIRVSSFHSPATVSKYLMKTNMVDNAMAPHPPELAPLFEAARFGGRAELAQAGPVDGPLWQYDIRSAYPTAMLDLPCWAHGHWCYGIDGRGESLWSLLKVSWQSPRGALWGPFPVRPGTGSLKWPTSGEGWFWQPEVEGCRHLAKVKILESWTWVQECDHEPFAYLRDLYAERRALKAAGDRREYVNKIALNASYGATGEKKRSKAQRDPRWRESAWAGLITATTRGTVGAVLSPSVIMTATDAIVTREPLQVPLGTALGEWEAKDYERGVFVGPGVYFLWNEGNWDAYKTSGIGKDEISPEEILAIWSQDGREGVYRYERQRFIGLGTALNRTAGLPPPTIGETVWRQFLTTEVARRLTLEPRREWLTRDVYDGRSKAPGPKTMASSDVLDGMRRMMLRKALEKETDPFMRLRLAEQLSQMSSSENFDQGSIFNDWDQP